MLFHVFKIVPIKCFSIIYTLIWVLITIVDSISWVLSKNIIMLAIADANHFFQPHIHFTHNFVSFI